MPKQDDAPAPAVCDGCGMERADVTVNVAGSGFIPGQSLCPDCAERRADDPSVTVLGRTLLLSEFLDRVDSDPDFAAALPGDSIREQLREKQAAIRRLSAKIRSNQEQIEATQEQIEAARGKR